MTLRSKWEFEYSAGRLATAAEQRLAYRQERVAFWEKSMAEVMAEVRESGIEVCESAGAGYSNSARGPEVMVRNDLQTKLNECHAKIREHKDAVRTYSGWIQVLEAQPEARLKLDYEDWLFFFSTK